MATSKKNPESIVREIKRKTRRVFNAEEKIRIVLEGLRGEESFDDSDIEVLVIPWNSSVVIDA